MSPTFKSITTGRALTTTGAQLPVEKSKPQIKRWRQRRFGNLIKVSIDAPGLVRRPRANGDAYYWLADATATGKAAIERGFLPPSARLHGTPAEIKTRCDELQREVELYLSEGRAIVNVRYTGTLGSLIKLYRASEESGYQALKYNVRRTYDYNLDALMEEHGKRHLSALNRKEFFKMHKAFIQPQEGGGGFLLSRGSRLMMLLRIVLKFGIGTDEQCERLCKILSTMQFEQPAARRQYLTAAHVTAFIRQALTDGFPKMALAQALQFETVLRQKDVIGEWWPDEDASDRNRQRRAQGLRSIATETWASGLIWGVHISPAFVMAKPTSKSRFKKLAIADLSLCPLAMQIIDDIPIEARIGPVIVDERTGLPYRPSTFSLRWRQIADRAGIPPDHCNMDSRSGGITEGSEADVDLEHLRQFATHSAAAMTQHYNRASLVKARKVHRARTAHRAQPDESKFDRGAIIDAER